MLFKKKKYFVAISVAIVGLIAISVVYFFFFSVPQGSIISYILKAREANLSFDYKQANSFYKKALKVDTTNQNLLSEYMLFSVLRRDNDAIKLADKLLVNNPEHFLANILSVTQKAKAGNLTQAIKELSVLKAEVNSLNDILLKILLSIQYYQADDMLNFEKSLATLKTSLPDIYFYEVFYLSLMANKIVEAQEALNSLNKDYMDIDTIILDSALQFKAKQKVKAQDNFRLYLDDHFLSDKKMNQYITQIDIEPNLGELLSVIVYKLSTLMSNQINLIYNSSDEIALLNIAVMLDNNNSVANLKIAEFYENIGDYQSAITMYNKIPDYSYYSRLSAPQVINILKDLNKYEQALSQTNKYLKLDPTNARLLLEKGHIYYQQKKYAQAIDFYTQALDNSKKYHYQLGTWLAYYFRGVAYDKNNNWVLAEKDLLSAQAINSSDILLVNYLAYSWIVRDSHMQEALSMLKTSLQSNPNQANLLDSYSWGLMKTKKYKEALVYSKKADLLMPYDATIVDHYGDILWQNGYQKQAIEQWKIAVNLDAKGELTNLKDKINHKLPTYLESKQPQSTSIK